MKYRLLIAVEVYDLVAALTRREQESLWKCFHHIREYPHLHSDYREADSEGRVHAGFAIHFWEDSADRHIKILNLCRADR